MTLTINDNITIGSYIFTYNPGGYDVKNQKLAEFGRTIGGNLRATGVSNGAGGFVVKKVFSISGLSRDQLDDIEAEFVKSEFLTFVSPDSKTYTVAFTGFDYSMEEMKPKLPGYSIELTEA